MTTKEWLNRGYRIDREIAELVREKERAFSRAASATAEHGGERVQTSRRNRSEDRFISYAEYGRLIDARIDELYKVKREIAAAIWRVKDIRYRRLLFLRYISFETWEDIADTMHYDRRYIFKLHGRALRAAEDVIGAEQDTKGH